MVDTFADARDRDILNLAEEMEQDMEADKRLLGTSHVEILFYHFVVFSLKKLKDFPNQISYPFDFKPLWIQKFFVLAAYSNIR